MSMNVSLMSFACFSKRVQKYNFFLISQVFLKKKLNFLFLIHLLNNSQNVATIAGCKGKTFFDSGKLFLKKNFLFYQPLTLS